MPNGREEALSCPQCGSMRFVTFAPPYGGDSEARCATCGAKTPLAELSHPALPPSANPPALQTGKESSGLIDERGKLERR